MPKTEKANATKQSKKKQWPKKKNKPSFTTRSKRSSLTNKKKVTIQNPQKSELISTKLNPMKAELKKEKLHKSKSDNNSNKKDILQQLPIRTNVTDTKLIQIFSESAMNTNKNDDFIIKPSTDTKMAIDIETMEPQKLSTLANNCEPGAMVSMPNRVSERRWKVPEQNRPMSECLFHPKRIGFTQSMMRKKKNESMRALQNELATEIRREKQMERMKWEQRQRMKEENQTKGMIVTPIRNMKKLKKFSKKQWRNVMKASVEMRGRPAPKASLRATYVDRIE